jgi:hypothetical protein
MEITSKKISAIVAQLSEHAQNSRLTHRHAAGVIAKHRLASIGVNHDRYTVSATEIVSVHAEAAAVLGYLNFQHLYLSRRGILGKNVNQGLGGLTIVVIRLAGSGKLANSKPCNACIDFMKVLGIKTVIYSNDEGQLIKEKLTDIESTHETLGNRQFKQKCIN